MRPLPFRLRRRGVRAIVALALLVAFAVPARAEPFEGPAGGPARELWLEGNQFWAAGEYARAADRFDRAYEIEHTPLLGLWVARSLVRAGRLVAAAARYHELSRQSLPSDASAKDWAAKRDAENEHQQLMPRIPSVVVAIDGATKEEVSVTINGQPLPQSSIGLQRFVDPGPARVRGARGEVVVEADVTLAEGEIKTVRLAFRAQRAPAKTVASKRTPRRRGAGSAHAGAHGSSAAATKPTGDGRRVVSYVAMGIGGATLLTGSLFGLLALDDEARLRGQCPALRCPGNLSSDVDAYESRKTIATVGLLSGTALTATGVVLYLTAPRNERAAQLGVVWLGSAVGLWGAF